MPTVVYTQDTPEGVIAWHNTCYQGDPMTWDPGAALHLYYADTPQRRHALASRRTDSLMFAFTKAAQSRFGEFEIGQQMQRLLESPPQLYELVEHSGDQATARRVGADASTPLVPLAKVDGRWWLTAQSIAEIAGIPERPVDPRKASALKQRNDVMALVIDRLEGGGYATIDEARDAFRAATRN